MFTTRKVLSAQELLAIEKVAGSGNHAGLAAVNYETSHRPAQRDSAKTRHLTRHFATPWHAAQTLTAPQTQTTPVFPKWLPLSLKAKKMGTRAFVGSAGPRRTSQQQLSPLEQSGLISFHKETAAHEEAKRRLKSSSSSATPQTDFSHAPERASSASKRNNRAPGKKPTRAAKAAVAGSVAKLRLWRRERERWRRLPAALLQDPRETGREKFSCPSLCPALEGVVVNDGDVIPPAWRYESCRQTTLSDGVVPRFARGSGEPHFTVQL